MDKEYDFLIYKRGNDTKEAKSIELFDRRLKFLVEGDSNVNKFYKEYLYIII